jgi:hypothetical protein
MIPARADAATVCASGTCNTNVITNEIAAAAAPSGSQDLRASEDLLNLYHLTYDI